MEFHNRSDLKLVLMPTGRENGVGGAGGSRGGKLVHLERGVATTSQYWVSNWHRLGCAIGSFRGHWRAEKPPSLRPRREAGLDCGEGRTVGVRCAKRLGSPGLKRMCFAQERWHVFLMRASTGLCTSYEYGVVVYISRPLGG